MKLISKFTALVLLGLSIFSCSKDTDIPEVIAPSTEVKTELINVDLEASGQEGGLRLAQEIDDRGHAVRPFLNDKNLKIRVAVRLNGNVNTITYQTLEFKKLTGLRARYTGQLTVPSGTSPSSDKYEIAGVLLGEVDGEEFTQIEGNQENSPIVNAIPTNGFVTAQENKLATKIPYVATWKQIKIVNGIVQPVNMDFAPNGTLLRFKITNRQAQAIKPIKIKVFTNAFFKDWKYDFRNLIGNNLAFGQRNAGTGLWLESIALLDPQTIDPDGTSRWYYMWVMPTATTQHNTSTKIWVELEGKGEALGFSSSHIPSMGSVPVNLQVRPSSSDANIGGLNPGYFESDDTTEGFPNGKIPLDYLAEYNVAPGGKTFVDSHANNASGYFSWEDALNINISGYHLPSQDEMRAILVPSESSARYDINMTKAVDELIVVAGEAYSVRSEYTSTGNGILYALRFAQGTKKDKLTAYRYERVALSAGALESGVKITARYLGNSFMGNLSTIANEAYWQNNASQDVRRFLPATGVKISGGAVSDLGLKGLYFTSTETSTAAKVFAVASTAPHVNNQWNKANHMAIRLFKTNP